MLGRRGRMEQAGSPSFNLAAVPGVTRESYLFFRKPVIAALLAVILPGASPTWLQVLSILAVSGSVLVEISRQRIWQPREPM